MLQEQGMDALGFDTLADAKRLREAGIDGVRRAPAVTGRLFEPHSA